jgi:DNA-directed RNA polymerase specialized sigma24 family protein
MATLPAARELLGLDSDPRTWLRIVDEETRHARIPFHLKEEAMGAVLLALARERPAQQYVRVCAKRRIIDWIRAELGHSGQREALRNPLPIQDQHPAPDWVAAAEARVTLEQIAPRLTPRQREAIGLLAAGHDAADVAKMLGVTRARVTHILDQVRRRITQ